jgi:hypothetical protein
MYGGLYTLFICSELCKDYLGMKRFSKELKYSFNNNLYSFKAWDELRLIYYFFLQSFMVCYVQLYISIKYRLNSVNTAEAIIILRVSSRKKVFIFSDFAFALSRRRMTLCVNCVWAECYLRNTHDYVCSERHLMYVHWVDAKWENSLNKAYLHCFIAPSKCVLFCVHGLAYSDLRF